MISVREGRAAVVSRRSLLQGAVGVAGASAVLCLTTYQAAAAKIGQQAVGYQERGLSNVTAALCLKNPTPARRSTASLVQKAGARSLPENRRLFVRVTENDCERTAQKDCDRTLLIGGRAGARLIRLGAAIGAIGQTETRL